MRAAAVALAALVLAPAAAGYVGAFQTPSHNIACEADSIQGRVTLGCVLFSADGPRGQKTWSMLSRGRATVHYVQANIATEVPVLRYGKTWALRGFTCTSRRTGLTCRNLSRHGFFLSRSRQRIF